MAHGRFPFGLTFIVLAALLSACAAISNPSSQSRVKSGALAARPGDQVNTVVLEAVVARAASIWDACHDFIGTSDVCLLNFGTRLAIGPNTSAMAAAGGVKKWDPRQWALFLDDRPIDLPSFGTFDYPRFHKGFNGQSEVFEIHRAWNVVITQITGQHTLRAVLQLENGPASAQKPGGQPLSWDIVFAPNE